MALIAETNWPETERDFDYWSLYLAGLAGTSYAYGGNAKVVISSGNNALSL
jgi:hypothetical protein